MDTKQISVYGSSGFIGSRWMKFNPSSDSISRESNFPNTAATDVLYFISTTHNYNIFDQPHKDVNTNLTKLIDVLEACRKTNKDIVFNFVSSWFVYGMNASLNTLEETLPNPTGFYSITKRAAEQMLICYCQTFGMKYRIFRMTNIIGETDKGVSLQKNAIQYMIGLLKKNEPVKLYDGGGNVRDFMYVDDACSALRVCIDSAPTNEIINISNMEPVTIGEVIEYSKRKLRSCSDVISVETPIFHKVVQVKDVCLNNHRLLSYGYKPVSTTYQGVDKLLYNEE